MIKRYKQKNKTYFNVQLSFTDKFGKRIQTKFRKDENGNRITSERKAKQLEAEALLKLKALNDNDYSYFTFKEWQLKFIDSMKYNFKKSTIMQYDGDLSKWLPTSFISLNLKDIRKDHIHQLIFEELPLLGATVHTQRRIWRNLRRVFEAAIEEGVISKNPTKGIIVKVPSTKKLVLNTKETEILLKEARACNHEFFYLWVFALFSGMRSGELYALRWVDVDEVSGTILISRQWTNKDGYHTTKSNKNRVLPISSELRAILLELRNLGPNSETLKGLDGSSQHFDDLVLPRLKEWKNGVQSLVTREFCKQINITQVKFHDLRATFITNLLSQGVPLAQVMSIVGHSKTSTTDEYLRLAGVNIKGATDKLGYKLPDQNLENVLSLIGKSH
jgi:integrase